MIEIEVPTLTEYNTGNASSLAQQLNEIYTLAEVDRWLTRAAPEVARLAAAQDALAEKQYVVETDLQRELEAHNAKPFLSKIFAGRKLRTQLLSEQNHLKAERVLVERLCSRFQAIIDFLPRSEKDLAELVRSTRQQRKELQVQKKGINAEMSAIRIDAKQLTAQTMSGSYGTNARRRIREDKQDALSPYENEKITIDKQIVDLDNTLTWLERFKR